MNKNEKALNKLKGIVDPDTYLKLSVFFAGETIYFPYDGTRIDKQQRNEAIRRDYREQGLTVRELIELYGLSESQIRRIISKVG